MEPETNITYEVLDEGVVCIKVQGQLTHSEIYLFEKIRLTLPECQKVIVDLSETKEVDSTGFGAFIHLKDSAEQKEREVILKDPNQKIHAFIEACHFDELFTIQFSA